MMRPIVMVKYESTKTPGEVYDMFVTSLKAGVMMNIGNKVALRKIELELKDVLAEVDKLQFQASMPNEASMPLKVEVV